MAMSFVLLVSKEVASPARIEYKSLSLPSLPLLWIVIHSLVSECLLRLAVSSVILSQAKQEKREFRISFSMGQSPANISVFSVELSYS